MSFNEVIAELPPLTFEERQILIRRALELIEAGIIHSRDFVSGERPLRDLPLLFKEMAQGNQAVKTFINVRQ